MGALLASSQLCVGFPSLFCDKYNLQKELCVLEMLDNQQTNYSSTCETVDVAHMLPRCLVNLAFQGKYSQRGDCAYSEPADAHSTRLTNSACANGAFMHASIFRIFTT